MKYILKKILCFKLCYKLKIYFILINIKMFIIILILVLFVAVLIYGFITIKKLNTQIEEFQKQENRVDDLSEKINIISSKLDFLTIEYEGTQEKHIDVDNNSLSIGYNNKFIQTKNQDDITTDNNIINQSTENQEQNIPEKEDIKENQVDNEIENKQDQNDTKSSDSNLFNFKTIDLENNDDINKFNIEVNENNFFQDNKENIQPNNNNDEPNKDINDQSDDNNDTKQQPDIEISNDYTNIKEYMETHTLQASKVGEMKKLIIDNKIEINDPSILTLKKQEMYNTLQELIKDK